MELRNKKCFENISPFLCYFCYVVIGRTVRKEENFCSYNNHLIGGSNLWPDFQILFFVGRLGCLPQRSYFYMYTTHIVKIDIVAGGYFIFVALETSNNVWVSKKYFSEYQYKLLSFKEESLVRKGLYAG